MPSPSLFASCLALVLFLSHTTQSSADSPSPSPSPSPCVSPCISPSPSPFPTEPRVLPNDSYPIIPSDVEVHLRSFAQLPDWKHAPFDVGPKARIVSMDLFNDTFYVSTSNSQMVYRVDVRGNVSPFLNVTGMVWKRLGRVVSGQRSNGGVRSVAVHPDFLKNGLVYMNVYEERHKDVKPSDFLSTPADAIRRDNPPDSVLYEFKYSFRTSRINRGYIREVMRVGLKADNHNMRQMIFIGKLLYITQGDGAAKFSRGSDTQDLSNALGKILRIDPRLYKGKHRYRVPKSNPFVGQKGALPEIWALGFRNPHTICHSKRHGIFSADIGGTNVEEINIVKRGRNYGYWKREGTFLVQHPVWRGYIGGITHIEPNETAGFTYPAAMFGHFGPNGTRGINQAIAGSCPIENASPLDGLYLYSDFAALGELFFSYTEDLKNARTRGRGDKITQATVYKPRIFFDHDNDAATEPLEFPYLREMIKFDMGDPTPWRADVRFGRGPCGEIYVSSKINGKIYIVTNSLPGKHRGLGYCDVTDLPAGAPY